MEFNETIKLFIELAQKHDVRMLMVGGGAVNFYGYKRHSADVDFWIDTSTENLRGLARSLNEMGYELDDFPDAVKKAEQNISIKISPEMEIELITRFNPGKSFDQAYADAEITTIKSQQIAKYRVLAYEDLINSKVRSGRPKDLLDIYELKRVKDDSETPSIYTRTK